MRKNIENIENIVKDFVAKCEENKVSYKEKYRELKELKKSKPTIVPEDYFVETIKNTRGYPLGFLGYHPETEEYELRLFNPNTNFEIHRAGLDISSLREFARESQRFSELNAEDIKI